MLLLARIYLVSILGLGVLSILVREYQNRTSLVGEIVSRGVGVIIFLGFSAITFWAVRLVVLDNNQLPAVSSSENLIKLIEQESKEMKKLNETRAQIIKISNTCMRQQWEDVPPKKGAKNDRTKTNI